MLDASEDDGDILEEEGASDLQSDNDDSMQVVSTRR